MNLKTKKLMDYINKCLEKNEQKIRIIDANKDSFFLSNNTEYNKAKLRKRVIDSKNKELYISNFDIIYGTDSKASEEKINEIKKASCGKGGKKVWMLYEDKIRKNLNSKSWNKGKKLHYDVWNKGLTKETDNRLKKISENRVGEKNPMFGKTHSIKCKTEQSNRMKKKILDGSFTPNIRNSNTHWKTIVCNKKYRSSWEGTFALLNPTYEYEKLRIKYEMDGKSRVYITDFISYMDKKVIEIKPKSHRDGNKMKAKEKSAIEWCKDNGFTFKIINEDYFIERWEFIDFTKMDENSKKNMLKMRKRYEADKKRRG